MSPQELERLALMRRIEERRTAQRLAVEQLGLTIRQVERLYAAYKAHGAEGLVSRKRGAPSTTSFRRSLPSLPRLAREPEEVVSGSVSLKTEEARHLMACRGLRRRVASDVMNWMRSTQPSLEQASELPSVQRASHHHHDHSHSG